MKIAEIAKFYGCSSSNIAQYLRQAERKLRHPKRRSMLNVFLINAPVLVHGKHYSWHKAHWFKEPDFHPEVIEALIKAEIYTPKQLNETSFEELQRVLNEKDFLLVCGNLELLRRKEERYNAVINNPECPEPVKELLDEDIESLEMTARTYNCLKRAGVNTVGELSILTQKQFDNIRSLTPKCKTEVQEKMSGLGFDFPHKSPKNKRPSLDKNISDAKHRKSDRSINSRICNNDFER